MTHTVTYIVNGKTKALILHGCGSVAEVRDYMARERPGYRVVRVAEEKMQENVSK